MINQTIRLLLDEVEIGQIIINPLLDYEDFKQYLKRNYKELSNKEFDVSYRDEEMDDIGTV